MEQEGNVILVSSSSPSPEPRATRRTRPDPEAHLPPQQSTTNTKTKGKGKEPSKTTPDDAILLSSDDESFPCWSLPGGSRRAAVSSPSKSSEAPFPIDTSFFIPNSNENMGELNGTAGMMNGGYAEGEGGFEWSSVPKRAAGGSQCTKPLLTNKKADLPPAGPEMDANGDQGVWEEYQPGPSRAVDRHRDHMADGRPGTPRPPTPSNGQRFPSEPQLLDNHGYTMYQAQPPNQYMDMNDVPIDFGVLPAGDPQHHVVLDDNQMAAAEPVDRTAQYLTEVLQLIPNVQVEHAETLVKANMLSNPTLVVEACVNQLFDDPKYPKVEMNKRKRKQSDREDENRPAGGSGDAGKGDKEKRARLDWESLDRGVVDVDYPSLAMEDLALSFKYITKSYIRLALMQRNWLYYPTYFHLREVSSDPGFHAHKKTASTPKRKGKGPQGHSPDFEREREAVLAVLAEEQDPNYAPSPTHQSESGAVEVEPADNPLPEGEGIECGCCFGEYEFDQMIQCPETHLFCKDCSKRNAAEALGQRKSAITCMDQSGCKLEFPQSELERFLDTKALELLDRIRADKAVAECGFESLDECPFCDFKCIIENEQEKLFRCENEDCMAVTCRQCKRPDHLPKSCQEMEGDRKLDARHAVEEAMTEALMRKCPKCSKAFVKEAGCNKMTCPHCSQLSCYICKQAINGYDHFNEQPGGRGGSSNKKNKCALWENNLDQRHHDEVAAAAKTALQKQREEQPDIEEEALRVDLPPAPAPATQPTVHANPIPGPIFGAPAPFNPFQQMMDLNPPPPLVQQHPGGVQIHIHNHHGAGLAAQVPPLPGPNDNNAAYFQRLLQQQQAQMLAQQRYHQAQAQRRQQAQELNVARVRARAELVAQQAEMVAGGQAPVVAARRRRRAR
ncbi:hypothetical protein FRB98_004298 [Tulasnella sp. 332]|nr:hypothetical protein FRB98_004298 [Tulasnella sp. 332]